MLEHNAGFQQQKSVLMAEINKRKREEEDEEVICIEENSGLLNGRQKSLLFIM